MRKVVKLRRGLSQLEETLGPPNVICCSIAFFVIYIPINTDFTSSLSICCSMFSAASAFLSISFWQLRMFSFNASIFLLKSFNNQNEIYHRMLIILNQTKSVKWLWRCCYWQHWRHKVAYWSRNWQFLEQTEIDNIWHRHRMFHR